MLLAGFEQGQSTFMADVTLVKHVEELVILPSPHNPPPPRKEAQIFSTGYLLNNFVFNNSFKRYKTRYIQVFGSLASDVPGRGILISPPSGVFFFPWCY